MLKNLLLFSVFSYVFIVVVVDDVGNVDVVVIFVDDDVAVSNVVVVVVVVVIWYNNFILIFIFYFLHLICTILTIFIYDINQRLSIKRIIHELRPGKNPLEETNFISSLFCRRSATTTTTMTKKTGDQWGIEKFLLYKITWK